MSRKQIGVRLLIAGTLVLILALFLIFSVKSSPWSLVVLGLSILVNTVGACFIIWK